MDTGIIEAKDLANPEEQAKVSGKWFSTRVNDLKDALAAAEEEGWIQ